MLTVGVHVSISGKIYHAIERAKSLGCSAMQIFLRNPQGFRKKMLAEEEIELFKKKAKAANIKPIIVHSPYTLNLAAAKKKFHRITIREFIKDLLEADKLNIDYLVTHIGSHRKTTETQGLSNVVKALREILKSTPHVKTKILLENTAGSGSWLGYRFSHQKAILRGVRWSKRVGICLDTAHAWAAGYAINTQEGLKALLDEIEREIGFKCLHLVHLNDTKEGLASRHDRHWAIGEGWIGEIGMRNIVTHPLLRSLPFILETPKKNDEDDIRNLERVRSLYANKLY